jgi:hypothetical protein
MRNSASLNDAVAEAIGETDIWVLLTSLGPPDGRLRDSDDALVTALFGRKSPAKRANASSVFSASD